MSHAHQISKEIEKKKMKNEKYLLVWKIKKEKKELTLIMYIQITFNNSSSENCPSIRF